MRHGPFGRAHTARRAPREGEVGPKGGGARRKQRGHDAAMVDAQLARALWRIAHTAAGVARARPAWGGAMRSGGVRRGGPRQAKPSEVNGCAMNLRHRRGIGKGTIAVLFVRSTCFGAFRRPSVVLAATGIAPSRSRAPRLTSRVGPAGGGWLGQIARHSSTTARHRRGMGSEGRAGRTGCENLGSNEGSCRSHAPSR